MMEDQDDIVVAGRCRVGLMATPANSRREGRDDKEKGNKLSTKTPSFFNVYKSLHRKGHHFPKVGERW
jgi:hypothetical protein